MSTAPDVTGVSRTKSAEQSGNNVNLHLVDANLDQGLYIYIYMDVCTDHNNGADVT